MERQQLKWFTYATVVSVLFWVAFALPGLQNRLPDAVVGAIFLGAVPRASAECGIVWLVMSGEPAGWMWSRHGSPDHVGVEAMTTPDRPCLPRIRPDLRLAGLEERRQVLLLVA